jgi:F0F1-type ATP synthase membrane subunit a
MNFLISNPLEQFQIVPLISIFMGRFDISFTNSALMAGLSIGFFLTLTYLILINGQGTLVPNRWQTVIESVYNFVSDLLLDNVGDKGRGYFPFIFVLFVFILSMNLIGMVPYSFTTTSHLVDTLFFSLTVY